MNEPHDILLQTKRLWLREMTEADAPALLRLNGNPNVLRYLPEPVLQSTDQVLEMLRTKTFPQYRDHRVGRWGVCLARSGELIGWCGLKYLADEQIYDLGYRLLESHWGRGYAFEAARAVLEWAETALPNARIVGQAHVDNAASLAVLRKLGLRYERTIAEKDFATAVFVRENS